MPYGIMQSILSFFSGLKRWPKEVDRKTTEFSVAYIHTYGSEVRQFVTLDRHDARIREANRLL